MVRAEAFFLRRQSGEEQRLGFGALAQTVENESKVVAGNGCFRILSAVTAFIEAESAFGKRARFFIFAHVTVEVAEIAESGAEIGIIRSAQFLVDPQIGRA